VNLTWLPAYSHGGPFGAGKPLGVVVHCTESDNAPGSAENIAGPGWFGGPAAGTSAHKVVDQNSICEGVHRDTVAWHVGPNGNGYYLGYEFCGRAAWSAAQWNAAPQLQMIRNAAPFIAADLKAFGAPARWLSLTQVANREKGLLTHNDVRLALGGTTHSDPGPNFPYAFLLSEVQKYMNSVTAPTKPLPAPAPKPAPKVIPAWTLSAGNYYGLITGPAVSHGGATAGEKAAIKLIQQQLIRKGFVPGVTNPLSGWADGVFGQPTADAVTRFQKKYLPKTTLFGQVWHDDWNKLFSL
jgi:hypothetical protein